MAMIPVSHISETSGDISFPWVVRCQRCGSEVARLDQAELTAMVMDETAQPVYCFDCEAALHLEKVGYMVGSEPSQFDRAPFPCISVPKHLLGLV